MKHLFGLLFLIGGLQFDVLAQLCIAHRGASDTHPENSPAAVRAAWEAGADLVEVDLQLLADQTLVLFHDDEVAGMRVSTLTLPQLREAAAELEIITLQTLLEITPADRPLLLDLKDPNQVFLTRLLEITAGSKNELHYQSKDLESLRFLREKLPPDTQLFYVTSLPLSGPLQRRPDPEKLAAKLKAANLNGITAKGRKVVNAAYVKAFQDQGLSYYVWTINEPNRMAYYTEIGVDGIITDRPGKLKELQEAVALPKELKKIELQ